MSESFLNKLISNLGQPVKVQGAEYIWQCPICSDAGKDNLKYNVNKNVFTCFKNPDHAKEIFKKIIEEDKKYISKKPEEKPAPDTKKLMTYLSKCQQNLVNDPESLAYLKKIRGITKDTVDNCGIGLDKEKRRWVLPIFSLLDKQIVGFEYRPPDMKKWKDGAKCKKEVGTPSCLAEINYKLSTTEVLVIIEGFLDGYLFFQRLTELNQISKYHIITPSNGVATLHKLLADVNFSEYKKVVLFLDNDEAGQEATKKIIEEYPELKVQRLDCGCKDYNDHYLKCITAREKNKNAGK